MLDSLNGGEYGRLFHHNAIHSQFEDVVAEGLEARALHSPHVDSLEASLLVSQSNAPLDGLADGWHQADLAKERAVGSIETEETVAVPDVVDVGLFEVGENLVWKLATVNGDTVVFGEVRNDRIELANVTVVRGRVYYVEVCWHVRASSLLLCWISILT